MSRKLRKTAQLMGVFSALVLISPIAHASDWHWGLGVGYGGDGITTQATSTATSATPQVNRADGPIMLDVYIDHFVTDTFMITISHSRGISAAPFSSGESFSGFSGSYYFLGAPPVIAPENGESSISIHRWTPFVGGSVGYAQASISRENSVVPTATGAGMYLGFRAGADYPTGPNRGWRPELVYASTSYTQSLSKSETPPPTLEHFSLQFSWYFGF